MPDLFLILLPGAVIHSLKDPSAYASLLTLAAIALATIPVVYRRNKKRNKTQRKELRKLKWKMRWALLKSFFRRGSKLSASDIILLLIAAAIGVLIIIWLGWLWGLLFILGLILITTIIDNAENIEPGE